MSKFRKDLHKRLENELQKMEKLREESNERFDFAVFGTPPTRYEVTFHCRGLVGLSEDKPLFDEEHKATIILHPEYLSTEAFVEIQWQTPILHPNIDLEHGPCITGTPLGADISIAQICEFLYDMIRFVRYKPDPNRPRHVLPSETSKQAAVWAQKHPELLPLDRTSLRYQASQSGTE